MVPVYRIHEKTLRISRSNHDFKSEHIITVSELDEIVRFLQMFGELVERLSFDGSGYSAQDKATITRCIRAQCANSLQELELCDAGDLLLTSADNSFAKLTKIVLKDMAVLGGPQLPHIYPALHELQLHPSVAIGESVLKAIPHLRVLHIHDSVNVGFLNSASKLLPNLESLKFGYYPGELDDFCTEIGQPIHFSGVRDLSIVILGDGDERRASKPFPVTFGRLRNLEILAVDRDDVPMKLIVGNADLESLSIPWINDADAIISIARQLQNISALAFEWPAYDNANLLVVLNACRALRTMHIVVWTFSTSVDDWAKTLPAGWQVVDVRADIKNPDMKSHVTVART